MGAKLNPVLCKIEDWLNAALGDGQFGGELATLMIVLFASDILTKQPAPSRLSTLSNSLNGSRERVLALHVTVPADVVLEATRRELFAAVSELLIAGLPRKLSRSPSGLDFERLRSAIAASVGVYAKVGA